jgi:23S rRNA pseudouridine1911/1915/1917 synthase
VSGAGRASRASPAANPGDVKVAGRFVVDRVMAGMRLDRFVAAHAEVSAATARKLIAAGIVRVDGLPPRKGTPLPAGTVVEIGPLPSSATTILPDASVNVVVIHEDQQLIAIDKPPGLPSHPLRAGERGTAANGIVARFPDCAGASPEPLEGGLGHRLDTATSGVLVAARARSVWIALRRALGAADCEKRYLCEVWGAPPDRGRVDAPIGRSGRRGRAVRVGAGRQPRPAETEWRVVGRGPRTALVEARLHAGRPHQVRAHLASAGFPIVGDDRYGGAEVTSATQAIAGQDTVVPPPPRLHLHAASVRFRHPATGDLVTIEAPLPAWATSGGFAGFGKLDWRRNARDCAPAR